MADRVALGVMARAPSDSRGKTRLIRELGVGSDCGAALRGAILLDTLDAIRAVDGVDRLLIFTPNDAGREIAGLGGDGRLVPQRGETLGERLEHAFADLFALGYGAVALVGSDLPTLPASYIERGIEVVMQDPDPVVLGPAEDGGYYFIALRRAHPELFRGIPWSTAEVLNRTCAMAAGVGLPVRLIPYWYDIDSTRDLQRAVGIVDAASPSSRGPRRLRAWWESSRHVKSED